MSMIKESVNTGMRKTENLKEQPKYYLFGLLTVLVYSYGSWKGVAVFYLAMFTMDVLLMYKDGEL